MLKKISITGFKKGMIIMMVVVMTLIICLLIGCGVQSVGSGDETDIKGDTTKKTVDSTDKTSNETETIRKDQPIKIRIGIMHPVTPSTFEYGSGVVQYFKDQFNVEPEFVYYKEVDEGNIKKIMESVDRPDLVLDMLVSTGYELGENGALLDFKTVENQLPNYLGLWDNQLEKELLMSSITKKGSDSYYVLIPCIYSRPYGGWQYNSLFEDYEYEVPGTIEELYDLAVAHKEKTGDAPIAINVYGNNAFTDDLFEGIATAYGTTSFLFAHDVDGNFISPVLDERWFDALRMYHLFLRNNLVWYSEYNWSAYNNLDNKCIFTYGVSSSMRTDNLNRVWTVPAVNIKSDTVDKAASVAVMNKVYQHIAVSNYCEDDVTAKIIEILDFLTTAEGIERVYFGEEGKTFEINKDGKIAYKQPINKSICPIFTNTQSKSLPYRFETYGLDHYFALSYPDWSTTAHNTSFQAWVDLNELNHNNQQYYKLISYYFIDDKINEKVLAVAESVARFTNEFLNSGADYNDYIKMVEGLKEDGIQDIIDYYNQHD